MGLSRTVAYNTSFFYPWLQKHLPLYRCDFLFFGGGKELCNTLKKNRRHRSGFHYRLVQCFSNIFEMSIKHNCEMSVLCVFFCRVISKGTAMDLWQVHFHWNNCSCLSFPFRTSYLPHILKSLSPSFPHVTLCVQKNKCKKNVPFTNHPKYHLMGTWKRFAIYGIFSKLTCFQ